MDEYDDQESYESKTLNRNVDEIYSDTTPWKQYCQKYLVDGGRYEVNPQYEAEVKTTFDVQKILLNQQVLEQRFSRTIDQLEIREKALNDIVASHTDEIDGLKQTVDYLRNELDELKRNTVNSNQMEKLSETIRWISNGYQ